MKNEKKKKIKEAFKQPEPAKQEQQAQDALAQYLEMQDHKIVEQQKQIDELGKTMKDLLTYLQNTRPPDVTQDQQQNPQPQLQNNSTIGDLITLAKYYLAQDKPPTIESQLMGLVLENFKLQNRFIMERMLGESITKEKIRHE